MKKTNGVVTKYVYGRGLIGEERHGEFSTYHFDSRGSTVAITDECGNVTDTFAYDTYGKVISRTGTRKVIFGNNGRDGVITEDNGLIYMRARYYSPEMKRFINADIISGSISQAVTLNRFAFANGNPVSFVDPFGLSADITESINSEAIFSILKKIKSNRDSKLASELLAMVLDQLLNFKNILVVNHTITKTIPVGLSTTITYSNSVESGSGNFNVGSIISDQLELAGSFSFPMGDNGSVSVDTDGTISIDIEYCANIDEHTMISASISANSDMSISAGYTVKTNDGYDNIVSTAIELNHKFQNTQKDPKKELTYDHTSEYEIDWGKALLAMLHVGFALYTTAIAAVAITETFGTGGVGIWNDGMAISAALNAWGKASQSLQAIG